MVLSISGLGSQFALQLIDKTRDKQIETLQREPAHARAEQAFRDRIGKITTPEELVQDYEVFRFVMVAFDLEDQIFGKAMMRKVLESDPSESSALVNRLTDSRFRSLHTAMGFTTADGPQTPQFDASWQDQVADRYFNRVFITENEDQNANVGAVLNFRDKVDQVTSWYHVLRDTELSRFFRIALGLPEEMASMDVDGQKATFERKYDIAKLSDPDERERLINRFIALADIVDPVETSFSSTAVSLMQNLNTSGQYSIITIDIPTIQYSPSSLYR